MAQENSRPKIFWKIIIDALESKSESTDVKELIDENRNNEIVSRNKYIDEKYNNYFVVNGNSYGENFLECHAIEEYMNNAHVSKAFRFSTVSLESLETIADSLKNSLPGQDEIPVSILKYFFLFTGSCHATNMQKKPRRGDFPKQFEKKSLFSR